MPIGPMGGDELNKLVPVGTMGGRSYRSARSTTRTSCRISRGGGLMWRCRSCSLWKRHFFIGALSGQHLQRWRSTPTAAD